MQCHSVRQCFVMKPSLRKEALWRVSAREARLMAVANVMARSAWDAVGLKHPDYAEHKPRLKAAPRSPPAGTDIA